MFRQFEKPSLSDLAAAEGHYNCVEYLLKYAQVDANKKDRNDNTPVAEIKKGMESDPKKYNNENYKNIVSLIENYLN